MPKEKLKNEEIILGSDGELLPKEIHKELQRLFTSNEQIDMNQVNILKKSIDRYFSYSQMIEQRTHRDIAIMITLLFTQLVNAIAILEVKNPDITILNKQIFDERLGIAMSAVGIILIILAVSSLFDDRLKSWKQDRRGIETDLKMIAEQLGIFGNNFDSKRFAKQVRAMVRKTAATWPPADHAEKQKNNAQSLMTGEPFSEESSINQFFSDHEVHVEDSTHSS
jgi:hypothetical protein